MDTHGLNGIWEIVELPPGKHAIGSRWFMKVKHNTNGFFIYLFRIQCLLTTAFTTSHRRYMYGGTTVLQYYLLTQECVDQSVQLVGLQIHISKGYAIRHQACGGQYRFNKGKTKSICR